LPAVLVAGDDVTVGACLIAHSGERGQHIVRLEAFAGQDGDAERLQHLLDFRDLTDELVGHLAALGFVGIVQTASKGGAGEVEGTDERVRLLFLDQVEHIAREAVDGPDLLAAGASHLRQGMEDLEDERVRVDSVDVPALDIDRRWLAVAGLVGGSGWFGEAWAAGLEGWRLGGRRVAFEAGKCALFRSSGGHDVAGID
jgi:hypothetical protein